MATTQSIKVIKIYLSLGHWCYCHYYYCEDIHVIVYSTYITSRTCSAKQQYDHLCIPQATHQTTCIILKYSTQTVYVSM